MGPGFAPYSEWHLTDCRIMCASQQFHRTYFPHDPIPSLTKSTAETGRLHQPRTPILISRSALSVERIANADWFLIPPRRALTSSKGGISARPKDIHKSRAIISPQSMSGRGEGYSSTAARAADEYVWRPLSSWDKTHGKRLMRLISPHKMTHQWLLPRCGAESWRHIADPRKSMLHLANSSKLSRNPSSVVSGPHKHHQHGDVDQSINSSGAELTSDSGPGVLDTTHSKGTSRARRRLEYLTTTLPPLEVPISQIYFSAGHDWLPSHDDPHAAMLIGADLEQRRIVRGVLGFNRGVAKTFLAENENRRTVREA
ncbi:hypothetical protein F4813DRAFT_397688 [Daldinia decipiens]|uniref:uncharacterized protein n=1 Tax=Daldinia decipiens TaxID=326647 RepID=UPI0020C259DE|nr:uncharacterized protein F4813DRAFT_397688 [Daldinia decipiens]KAI1656288.1 hypothetical protein F4813DRAFT_397688 [Daldinia decipiens]